MSAIYARICYRSKCFPRICNAIQSTCTTVTPSGVKVVGSQPASAITKLPEKSPKDFETMLNDEDPHRGFGTVAIHAGPVPDPQTGAVCVPISLASTFAQTSPGVNPQGWEYSRTGNPTRMALEVALAACEKAKHGVCFASGMAAAAAVVHMLKTGDHIVSIDDVYSGMQGYFRQTVEPNYGIDFSFGDLSSVEAVEAKIIPNKTKMIWLESPTNPTLKVSDIRMIAGVAKKHGLLLAIDNTFMSPYFQNPLELGADLVVHSLTKYINGHSDVIMGAVLCNRDDLHTKLRSVQNGVGGVPSPFDCYLALRGLKTLHIRMAEHAKNAMTIAKYLEAHPSVTKVLYPGLPSHPQHKIAVKQAKGFGGMIAFYIKGGLPEAKAFLGKVKLFTVAASLGAVESLCESPMIVTHGSFPKEQLDAVGINDSLIRLSIGIEGLPDLIKDLEQALA